jgi:hypothetical protein
LKSVRLSREFLALLREITFEDVLESVFNSKSTGTVEVVQIPQNKTRATFQAKVWRQTLCPDEDRRYNPVVKGKAGRV